MPKGERFLKTYGILLICFSICGIFPLLSLYFMKDRPPDIDVNEFVTFFVLIGGWYLITGIAILLRRKWGYFFFKFFLYILLLGFPLGTFIAYKSLKYLKRYDIKALFGFHTSREAKALWTRNEIIIQLSESKTQGQKWLCLFFISFGNRHISEQLTTAYR